MLGRSGYQNARFRPNVFDEAQKIAGKDPDFHRRDLAESIDKGDYPEYEHRSPKLGL
ncbi:MAG: catalase [Chamaesiphon sp.]|nr:catalase [Chamaesiphon sp.]